MSDLFFGTSGPRDASIVIVGESWGATEAWEKLPFVGSSGEELTKMLAETGIRREDCFITNVVAAQPPSNHLWRWMENETTAKLPLMNKLYPNQLVRDGVARLYEQIRQVKPKLVVAVGNWSFWALSEEVRTRYGDKKLGEDPDILLPSGIMDFRGSMLYCGRNLTDERIPLLPVIHPAAIMRAWELRAPTVHDFRTRIPKALRNDWSPKFAPQIIHMPNFSQAEAFFTTKLAQLKAGTEVKLAHDIETRGPYCITCMGFADSATRAIVIPFIKKDGDYFAPYWSTKEEAALTRLIDAVLGHPNTRIIGQFYHYDSTYIHKFYGIIPYLFHDTHGCQHLLWPGTTKDLGYLSSVYCSYHRYWKDDNKEWDAKGTLDAHFLYNGEDCIRTFEIHERQLELIRLTNNEARWKRTMARHHLALEMSIDGIPINMSMKAELSMSLAYESQLRVVYLLKLVPQAIVDEFNGGPTFKKKPGQPKTQTFWPTSTAQQKVLFYEIFQMGGQRNRKTKALSLDKEAIPKLKARYRWAEKIFDTLLELRSIDVFASTFVNARVDPDHRMRTSFNAAGTETFRWSSSQNPFGTGGNFQNLPKGKEL